MNRYELIDKINYHVGAATGAANLNHHEHYAEQMSALLDLLLKELAGSPPRPPETTPQKWNPEKTLEEIAIAIKHRTISTTQRWCIVYYYRRITCVPSNFDAPVEIILGEFTEKMVQDGFTIVYWNQIKTNIIKLYEELYQ